MFQTLDTDVDSQKIKMMVRTKKGPKQRPYIGQNAVFRLNI